MESTPKRNPIRTVWGILSFPLAVLGLLGLSDSLVSFKSDIQQLIDSYQIIVYPVFDFVLGWLWFETPKYVYDYLFLGVLFASNERKVWGFIRVHESLIKHVAWHIYGVFWSVIFWPFTALEMAWQIKRSDKTGLITNLANEPKPFYVKYMFRDADVLVFQYIGAVLLGFVIVLIANYALL